jgi:hypothetical protein
MLQKIPKQFQGSPSGAGCSTQHERNMEAIRQTGQMVRALISGRLNVDLFGSYLTSHLA